MNTPNEEQPSSSQALTTFRIQFCGILTASFAYLTYFVTNFLRFFKKQPGSG
jgi:hypothetical protein